MATTPLISIIIGGRNDNYQQDWIGRLEYVLNFDLLNLDTIGLGANVEFCIVDYGSKNKIRDHIRTDNKSTTVKFIEVDFQSSDEVDYHVSKALNIGLKNATGKYCMITGSDQFLSATAWYNLINFLKKKETEHLSDAEYYYIPRKQFPNNFDFRTISFLQLNTLINSIAHSRFNFRNLKHSIGAGAGALLASKYNFKKVGCFDEAWGGYGGQDNEISFKLFNRCRHFDLSAVGISIYKLPYNSGDRTKKTYGNNRHTCDDKLGLAFESITIKNSKSLKESFARTQEQEVNTAISDACIGKAQKFRSRQVIQLAYLTLEMDIHISLLDYWRIIASLKQSIPDNVTFAYFVTEKTLFNLPPLLLSEPTPINSVYLWLKKPISEQIEVERVLRLLIRSGHIGHTQFHSKITRATSTSCNSATSSEPWIAIIDEEDINGKGNVLSDLVATFRPSLIFVITKGTKPLSEPVGFFQKKLSKSVTVFYASGAQNSFSLPNGDSFLYVTSYMFFRMLRSTTKMCLFIARWIKQQTRKAFGLDNLS